jgi:hypothetical protein
MAPQIEKQQFQNQSGGYVGVVVIGVKGEDRGIAVEPDGYVWLSEEEQRLTANAPRRPEDNPFVAQTRQRRNEETDALEDYEVVPLVPVSEERFVPADLRPVPGVQSEGAGAVAVAQAAATGPEPVVPISEDIAKNPVSRHDEVAGAARAARRGDRSRFPRPAGRGDRGGPAADRRSAPGRVRSRGGSRDSRPGFRAVRAAPGSARSVVAGQRRGVAAARRQGVAPHGGPGREGADPSGPARRVRT